MTPEICIIILCIELPQWLKESAFNAGDPGSILESRRSLEKELATYSSNLAWEITKTEDSGRLQSMGLQRVGHNRAT